MTEQTIEQIKAKAFYKPEEAITLIRQIVEDGKAEGFVTTFELEAVLDKIAITGGTVSFRGIKAGVLEAINRAREEGVNTANLFAFMRRGGDSVPMAAIEQALTELEKARQIYRDRSGALSVWRYGTDPSAKD